MPRVNVSITDEFKQAVAGYATRRGISESAALVELAGIGYFQITGIMPPAAMNVHGGSRELREKLALDIERIEVQLRGFPPLADDE